MSQLDSSRTVEPFGEINIFLQADGVVRIRATILMKPQVEGAQTGLAIDGSNSMNNLFGASAAVSSIFGSANNVVQPVARTMAEYLANFDSDGNTTVIYWACSIGGNDVQEVGDMDAAKARTFNFSAPKNPGTRHQVTPGAAIFYGAKISRCTVGHLCVHHRCSD